MKAARDADVSVESLDDLVEYFTAAGKKGVAEFVPYEPNVGGDPKRVTAIVQIRQPEPHLSNAGLLLV